MKKQWMYFIVGAGLMAGGVFSYDWYNRMKHESHMECEAIVRKAYEDDTRFLIYPSEQQHFIDIYAAASLNC